MRLFCLPRSFQLASYLAMLALPVCLAGASSAAELFTVGSGGTHPSIQGAINACSSDGCTIQLLDSVYKLPRELWIEGKRNLAIERSAALKQARIRPRLTSDAASLILLSGTAANPGDPQRPAGWKRWPVSCKDTLGGSLDADNPYSTNGYQYNGLVVVVSSKDIRLEGLALDGQIATYFGNKGIWDCRYDVFFGNIGVNLFQSARVTLRDSELRNFFSAIYIQNRNTGGAVPSPNPNDPEGEVLAPYSRYGAMGDHLVEGNDIHHNWWAVFDEMEWDLGSTFRFNRVASNVNPKFGNFTEFLSEAANMPGGFMYVKDVTQAIHRIHNNTIWGSPAVIAHGSYKYGVQHLFYNNIVGGFEEIIKNPKLKYVLVDYRQLLSDYHFWLENNLFELRDSTARVGKVTITNIGPVPDTSVCTSQGMLPPCYLKLDTATTYRYVAAWPWEKWTVATNGYVRVKVGGNVVSVQQPMATELFPGGGLVKSFRRNIQPLDVTQADNLWAFVFPMKSTIPGEPGFLEPDWNDSLVMRTTHGNGAAASGWSNTNGRADRGAVLSDGTTPTIWALHSQEPILKAGSNCYRIPLRTLSGATGGSARIATVQAWSATFMEAGISSLPQPGKILPIRPLADSTFVEGQWQTFCLDSTPSPTAGLRFHVGLSRSTASGMAYSEPAYFLLANPAADVTVGASRARRSVLQVRASWIGGGLALRGLGDGPTKVVVRTLEGRTVLQTRSVARGGMLFVPHRTSSTGTAIVVVEQDGLRASARIVRVAIR